MGWSQNRRERRKQGLCAQCGKVECKTYNCSGCRDKYNEYRRKGTSKPFNSFQRRRELIRIFADVYKRHGVVTNFLFGNKTGQPPKVAGSFLSGLAQDKVIYQVYYGHYVPYIERETWDQEKQPSSPMQEESCSVVPTQMDNSANLDVAS